MYTGYKDPTLQNYTVTNEPQTIKLSANDGWGHGFTSNHIPVMGQPITATINGSAATIVATTPNAGEIKPHYADARISWWECHASDVDKAVVLSYTGKGSVYPAVMMNEVGRLLNLLQNISVATFDDLPDPASVIKGLPHFVETEEIHYYSNLTEWLPLAGGTPNARPTISALAVQNISTSSIQFQGVIADTDNTVPTDITEVTIELHRNSGYTDLAYTKVLTVSGDIANFHGAEDWYTWTNTFASGTYYPRAKAKDSGSGAYGAWTNGGGFSILSVTTGLDLWLDAFSITGKSDGETISQWNDSSTNARHFTQATTEKQPLYKTNIINGKPVVKFDGINDLLRRAGFQPATSTIFAVVKPSVTANQVFGVTRSAGGGPGYGLNFTTNKYRLANYGNDVFSPVVSPDTATTDAVVITAIHNRTANNYLYINGVSKGNSAWNSPDYEYETNDFVLGGAITTNNAVETSFFNGDIAELIIYNVALNDTDINNIENYLATKYNITVA